jgi:hypothetical protein
MLKVIAVCPSGTDFQRIKILPNQVVFKPREEICTWLIETMPEAKTLKKTIEYTYPRTRVVIKGA